MSGQVEGYNVSLILTAKSGAMVDKSLPSVAGITSKSSQTGGPIQSEIASWSSDTKSSFNGQVLSIEGSLGFDGLELFRDSHVVLERGFIYGLAAPNGSGKTSLIKALPTLPDFPSSSQFRIEYLCADDDHQYLDYNNHHQHNHHNSNQNANNDKGEIVNEDDAIITREYCSGRIKARVQEIEQEIDRLESVLESFGNHHDDDDELLENITNQLGELYDIKDHLELNAATHVEQMFTILEFGDYADMEFLQLSSGWRYKCQLISALSTRPDCLVVDEPSFLDTAATSWLISELQQMAKSNNAMIVLISHKEALMEELCDRILYLNPASKKLMVYNCGFREFQAAHADRVAHAKKSKESADDAHKDAKESLGNIRKQLCKREKNHQERRLAMFTDKRWVRGKCKEAKQKADHSAASKVKRVKKLVEEAAAREEELREATIAPLQLESADLSGNDARPLVEFCDASFQYEGSREVLLEYMDLQIAGTDKVLVQGANGQGKTTLVKLILGQLEATSGEIRRNTHAAAHFQQDALSNLIYQHGHTSAVDFLLTKNNHASSTGSSAEEARQFLGRFGLKGVLCLRPIRTLSAGQRVRLWLAREFWGNGNKPALLILDETTENLDKQSTDSLLQSLETFSAAILAISHDDYFCEQFPFTQLWEVGYGRVRVHYEKF